MKMYKIRNALLLFSLAVFGLLVGVWLSPQEPITSFLPTQSESEAYKGAVNTLAFVSGVCTSIFAFLAGCLLRFTYVQVATAVAIVGLLYIGNDIIRFGQLTLGNLMWLFIFGLGMLLILVFERFLVFLFKRIIINNK
ncbi:hypothetical protein [uncultured Psychrosphaera sp.]|uniref:hypothetical protein n=1 Tax=uncultured Psychrosphaera sp. TaxID=1403522 RepID=UPI002604A2C4|nr:hypothetical protein [uncultured Psychrosphaera sp.]